MTKDSDRQTELIVAAFILIGWFGLAMMDSQAGVSSTLFTSRDLGAIHMLGVLPLASLLVMPLQQFPAMWIRVVVAVLPLVASAPMMSGRWADAESLDQGFVNLGFLRIVLALGLDLGLVSLALVILPRAQQPSRMSTRRFLVRGLVGILAAMMLPTVYVQARCQHEGSVLQELLEQSRLGEARVLVQDLRRLSPTMTWHGRSLKAVAREMDRQIREIESQIARSLEGVETEAHRLHRCRNLAMLGRTTEALASLSLLQDSHVGVDACHLSGLIHEASKDWETARDFHRRAKSGLLRQAANDGLDHQIARAAVRVGFCERKLGNYELAEVEYRDALARSPSADNHFLLAQFYEDMQQTEKSLTHARIAMQLAPQRFQQEGRLLVRKLTVGHFGCLQAYAATAR